MDLGYAPGSEFPEGDTRIRYKATDAFGLTSLCDLIITVNGKSIGTNAFIIIKQIDLRGTMKGRTMKGLDGTD